jgi:hypothetical protein
MREVLLSIASIGLLIVLLAVSDERVRDQMRAGAGRLTQSAVSQTFAQGRGHLRTAGVTVQSVIIESGPLAALVIVGTVLFVGMLRT